MIREEGFLVLSSSTRLKGTVRLWQLLLLFIVLTWNSSSCTATNNSFSFTISEGLPKGTVVGNPFVKSGHYEIESGTPNTDDFNINQTSGKITTAIVLDREKIPSGFYNLTINDLIALSVYYVSIYVQDLNDNSPKFVGGNFDKVNLFEGHWPSQSYKIIAADPDNGANSTQNYNIISGNVDDVFKLDIKRDLSNNLYADLVLNDGKTLDRETKDFYVLNISASDGGTPPRKDFLQLNITVLDYNDNPPVFTTSNYTVFVPEDIKVSSSIVKVSATDQDIGTNAKIYYYIISSDPNNEFSIDKNSGVISPNIQLDYETKKGYKLTVKAENTDSSNVKLFAVAIVNIIVKDINDNDPKVSVSFSKGGPYQVYENAKIGEEVARVSVSDADSGSNGEVNVTLEGGDGYFSMKYDVKSSEFVIYVGKKLDRELHSDFILTASCVDNGVPLQRTTQKFKINVGDINDNYPIFDRHLYTSRVFENATVGTVIASVSATDQDIGANAQLVYSFANSTKAKPYSKWFDVNSVTGVITTVTPIDREQVAVPVLLVIASDKGTPPLKANCTVIINITDTNDNDPSFNQSIYVSTLVENSPSNTYILNVYAEDPDLGHHSLIKYTLSNRALVPFKVDPNSGAISATSTIDHEMNAMYSFEVIAIDGGGRKAFATVNVTIVDQNDNSPMFSPQLYHKDVKEDVHVGTTVATVIASDKDSGVFSKLTYSFISGNDDGLFNIGSSTGVITVAKKLDRETEESHLLLIGAVDGGGKLATNNATVNITVLDVNDEPPIFEHSSYNYTIVENSQPQIIGTVKATSRDAGVNAHITYSIIAGNIGNHFTINATGTLYLRTPIDRETTPQVNLTVQAADGGKPTLYGYTHVCVNVTDINDNAPQFNGSILEVFLPENTLPGASFYKVKAVDRDSGSFGQVTYSLVTNPGQLFQLHQNTGALSLLKPINFESGSSYLLVVKGEDGGMKSTQVTLNITVVDVNDHAPIFTNSSYTVHVSEARSTGSDILKVSATDKDSGRNALVSYKFKASADTAKFGLKPDGWIYLKSMLDCEEKDMYKLTVIASDQGLPTPMSTSADVTVLVDDENDNNPVFRKSLYVFYVQEEKPIGTVVGSVLATDKDKANNGKVTYKFESALKEFTINKDTGEIKTNVVLDREKKSSYTTIVVASDGGASARIDKTQVTIVISDVNDNSPVFNPAQYSEKVYEDVAVGTTLVKVRASDADEPGPNSDIRYSIVAGQQNSPVFAINVQTGDITVATSLDREKKDRYILHVDAKDLGKPPKYNIAMVTINILDVNDNKPRFLNMTDFVNVPEKLPVGSNVTQVKAVDNDDGDNGRIVYEIVQGNTGNTFQINKTTGLITTRILLDFERQNRYQLKISAKDMGHQQHITYRWVNIYVLDANDNRPTFDKNPIIVSVMEGVPINHTVKTIQAHDDDSGSNSLIWYSIDSQFPEAHFKIDPMSGAVQTISNIDRETISEYTLIIRATDQAFTQKDRLYSTATLKIIVLDINDNKPEFVSRDIVYVMEDEPFNFEIMTITAIDRDQDSSGRVDYRIVSGDAGKFTLDLRTGLLKKIGQLDYESQRKHVLNISATDEGSPPLSSYQLLTIQVVDVNDNPPEFTKRLYNGSVSEGEAAGTVVLQVTALDRDSGSNAELTYSIPSNALKKRFSINRTSGWITTNVTLDREEQSSYSFVVYATGSTYPFRVSTTNVKITILDKNDNAPFFAPSSVATKIMENSPAHVFYTVTAKDLDDGLNSKVKYRITSGDSDGAFSINEDSGELSTLKELDRELVDMYNLTIEAKDVAAPFYTATCHVIVIVDDSNDNAPSFLKSKYSTVTSETIPIRSSVLNVTAVDRDSGSNGQVVYSLSNDSYSYFRINPQSGVITTEARFDTSKKADFIFHCFAHDQGRDPKMAVVQIKVTIQDMNTHYPVFVKTPYQGTVFRNASRGTTVLTVSATDDDTNKTTNGKISYRLKDESLPSSKLFVLESNTGTLKTSSIFNDPPSRRHILYIIAQDHGQPAKSTEGIIDILIGAVQDDPPVFVNKTTSSVTILENTPANSYVTTVIARSKNNSPVTYNIISGNLDNAFTINADSGVITVQASDKLDYEVIKEYRLQLVATLKTGASLNGYMTLYVRLTDVNDNDPVFHPNSIITQVSEDQGQFVSRDVVMVTASDADSTSNAELMYSLESGNVGSVFSIDTNTGQIKTAKLLDRETVSVYNLVVKATDQGRPPRSSTAKITVAISDINDNPPVFNVTKVISIPENTRLGTTITIATASDPDDNTQFVYSLKSASVGGMFAVNRFSGAVTLLEELDYETVKTYSLVIQVSDGKYSDDVTVTIHVTDVNDNTPVFTNSSYQLKLTQSVRGGVPLLRVRATDKDSGTNGKIRYSFLHPVPEYSINVTSGVIATKKLIEVGIRDSLSQILVVATDQGSPRLRTYVYVRILITGEPQFDRAQYTTNIPEDTRVGTTVLTVKTTENPPSIPSARISFVIESGDFRNQFRIGQRSGIIRVNAPLDYETDKSYQLVIRAFDDVAPSNLVRVIALVNITDVNDNKPVFRKARYLSQWKEDVAIGTIVMNVSATDGDSGTNAQVWYAIQSGDDGSSFTIDRIKGAIRTVKELDHDTTKNHYLSVRATDQGNPAMYSEVSVTIQVLDLNDNAPVFHVPTPGKVRVPENRKVGTEVYNLTAVDRDSDGNGRITYSIIGGDGKGHFVIDSVTGLLKTNDIFDYEIKSSYSLQVKAVDGGSPPLQSNINITVYITSVDEFSPVFPTKGYSFKVPGNAEVGDVVGAVSATDYDGGEDGQVFYSFVNPTTNALRINKTSGVITVNRTLNDGSNLQQQRKRRSIDYLEDALIGRTDRKRRAAEEANLNMLVQADSGKPNSKKATTSLSVKVDYTCPGCAIVTKDKQTGGNNGITDKGLTIIVALSVLVGVIILAVVAAVLFFYSKRKRKRKRKNPRLKFDGSFDEITVHPSSGNSNHGAVSAESIPTRTYPQEYTPLTRTTDNSNNASSTDASETPGSASSGRGSSDVDYEESPTAFVNGDIGSVHSDNFVKTVVPDSGIQENDDDRISQLTISDGSGILHHDDNGKPYKNDKILSKMDFQSQESMHVFGEEGGGEADGGHENLSNLLYAKIAEVDGDDESISESPRRYNGDRGLYAGSLSSIIGSKEELSGSYNWDYLLDWGPQFQPLAEVFHEIGRMKDDTSSSSGHNRQGIVSIPSSTRLTPGHLPGRATTDMLSSVSSLPRSPISPPSTQFTSPAFSPNFTPAITPLITRSPSVSPLDTGTSSPSFSPQASRPASAHLQLERTRTDSQGDSNSELSHSPSISDDESNMEIEI